MGAIQQIYGILANPTVYRVWQAPFANAKIEPIQRHNDLSAIRRVLDVGCGPGTNAELFRGKDYLGLDLNEEYVCQARRRYQMQFEVADVCTYQANERDKFDFILLNSLLHHIATDDVDRTLRQLTLQVADDGHVHIIDLVLPEETGIARRLALADRGDFARPLATWKDLFNSHFETVVFEPFSLKAGGVKLWDLVYFKGAPRI